MVFLDSVTLYRGRITHRFVVASAISCILFADIALAQTPPNIQGNWVAKTVIAVISTLRLPVRPVRCHHRKYGVRQNRTAARFDQKLIAVSHQRQIGEPQLGSLCLRWSRTRYYSSCIREVVSRPDTPKLATGHSLARRLRRQSPSAG